MGKTVRELVDEARAQVESLTPEQLALEATTGDVTILDVREPDEWEAGHIPGAVHIPRGWLEFKADPSFPLYDPRLRPGARIVTHCRIGLRGALAAATLKAMGYARVANLEGGLEAWRAKGQPVTPGEAHPPRR